MFAYRNLQGRLRKVVLWCLHRLDLADCKAKPALELLESLLQRFQKLLLEGQRQIGGKKQWLRLQTLLGQHSMEGVTYMYNHNLFDTVF